MNSKGHKAINVLRTAYSVFSDVGGDLYSKNKANAFLNRCGADITKPKEQLLSAEAVQEAANAMFDRDCEKDFWERLQALEKLGV